MELSSQLYSMPMDNDFKFYQAINTRRWDARRSRISALRWSWATCFSRRAENSPSRRNRLNSGLDEIGRGSQIELRKVCRTTGIAKENKSQYEKKVSPSLLSFPFSLPLQLATGDRSITAHNLRKEIERRKERRRSSDEVAQICR